MRCVLIEKALDKNILKFDEKTELTCFLETQNGGTQNEIYIKES